MFWNEKPKLMLSRQDMAAIEQVFERLGARFRGLDAEVETLQQRCAFLESEVKRLSAKPHQSLKSRLSERGRP